MAKHINHDEQVINSFRKLFQRLLVVIGVCCVLVAVRSITAHVVAQENRSWMISGAAIRGLSGGHRKTTDSKLSWMAEVEETEWQYVVIHHSATKSGSAESIHEEHLNRRDAQGNPWLGIGYHFVIGNGQGMPDGTVQATFRWKEQIHGAHSGSEVFNARGIGICLIGNFEDSQPSKAQIYSLKSLVKILSARHRITPERLVGHASVKATACPGKYFPLNEIRRAISETEDRLAPGLIRR